MADWGEVWIGRVSVAGDWIASNLSAGVDLETGAMAPQSEPNLPTRIDSITIGGQVLGTVADGESYLFTAQVIGRLTVGGTVIGPLTPGSGNDLLSGIGVFGDVTLKELPGD